MQPIIHFRTAIALLTCMLLAASSVAAQQVDSSSLNKSLSLIADGAKPELVSNQFAFTEGPAADKDGNVYFTDQPNNRIWKYGVDGKLSLFMDSAGRSNGMYFDKDQQLVTCADEHNQLWRIDANKKVTVLVQEYQGSKLNGPNDLWIDTSGSIYFTDPYYQREYWKRTQPEITEQQVYYLPKGQQPIIVASDLLQPNGIIGSPDNKHLYVADIKADKTYKYSIRKDGTLADKKLFVAKGSDGMTLDAEGNLYLTGDGVFVYDPTGKLIEHILVPEPWSANVCFGGRNRDQLFITASKSLYILRMKVKAAF